MSRFKFALSVIGFALVGISLMALYQGQTQLDVIWGKQWGTTEEEWIEGIALDRQGSVYISGVTKGNLFGQNQGERDIFIVKLDSNGQILWSKQLGTAEDEAIAKIAVDGQANIYVLTQTEGDWFGKGVGLEEDVVLLKLSPNGQLVWGKRLGTNDCEFGHDIAVDQQGYVYIVGLTDGSLFAQRQREEGESEGFIAKFDPDGNLVWGKQLKDDVPDTVAVDSQGNIYVSATAYDDINNAIVVSLAKYASDGTLVWRQVLPTDTEGENIVSLSVDGSGNVYGAGEVVVYRDENQLVGVSDAFIVKYNGANGQRLWSKRFNSQEQGEINESFEDVTVDGQGNVYVVGYADGSLFGSNLGDSDVVLAKFDAQGNLIWGKQWGSAKMESGSVIAVDGNGNIYVAGLTDGDLFGTNAGDVDAFVIKFRQ